MIIRLAQCAYAAGMLFLMACAASPKPPNESPGQGTVQADPLPAGIHSLAGKILADIPNNTPLTLAVFDFSTVDGYTVFSRYLTDELSAALHESGRIRIIERENLAQVMQEQEYQLSGFVDDKTAKDIGKIIGVGLICFGRITDLPQSLLISCRIIEVETGAVVSIANTEIVKGGHVLALLTNSSRTTGTASNTQQNNQRQADKTITAPVPEQRPAFQFSDDDLTTEAGQTAAVRRYIPFVVDNLMEISVKSIEPLGNSNAKPDQYKVKLIWEYKEKFETIRAMADFFRSLPQQQGQALRSGSGNIVFEYYPAPYSTKTEKIGVKLFPGADKLLTGGFSHEFRWDLEFTLFDRNDYSIDSVKTSMQTYGAYGHNTRTKEHIFTLNQEAYSAMKDIRLTSKKGGLPQYGGGLLY